jgi:nucleoid-associated protein YgaU
MATKKKTKAAKRTTTTRPSESKVTVDRGETTKSESKRSDSNFLDRIQNDLEKNQSYLNLILGALIVIVLGVLIFNYFNKPDTDNGNVTPTAETTTTDESGDVTKESLPGKYKVKEGDTLFTIAQKYYDDGGKYTEIMKDNNLTSENIEVGQELNIPKLETASADPSASPEASGSPEISPSPSESPQATEEPISMASPSPAAMDTSSPGTGGAENQTVWGETITGDSYTVQAGDWLSKISGRAYGDITKYDAIAKANNIQNPDNIEVGTVLKIPRG